jgi:hypothetical protein
MATVTKFELPASRTPRNPTDQLTPFSFDIAVQNGDAGNGDFINVFTPPAGARILGATLRQNASLGAAATAQLRMGGNAITPATTAAAASGVVQNAQVEPANGTTDKIDIAIAGAGITAAATLRVAGMMIIPGG